MFTQDRDLLALEPAIFRDVGWAGQRLISATGSISGTTLTLTGAQTTHLARGHVAVIDGLPVEIIEVTGAQTLIVSLLRPHDEDDDADPIPPPALANKPVTVHTFAPQIAIVHDQLLRAAGLEPTDPGSAAESAITNAPALRQVETAGALHLIYSAAAALAGPQSHLAARAQLYAHRYRALRAATPARLDLDGDGEPDTIRPLHVYRLLRA